MPTPKEKKVRAAREKMKSVIVCLPESLIKEVDDAKADKQSRSHVLREIVKAHFS